MKNKNLTKFNKFMINSLSTLGLEEDFPSLIKGIYEKPMANNSLKGEQTNIFPKQM